MTQAPERSHLTQTLLIGRDTSGNPRVIDLNGITIELVVPAPKVEGGIADLQRRLAETESRLNEAREGLEFYSDPASYARKGRGKSRIENDAGAVATDTLKAISGDGDQ